MTNLYEDDSLPMLMIDQIRKQGKKQTSTLFKSFIQICTYISTLHIFIFPNKTTWTCMAAQSKQGKHSGVQAPLQY